MTIDDLRTFLILYAIALGDYTAWLVVSAYCLVIAVRGFMDLKKIKDGTNR